MIQHYILKKNTYSWMEEETMERKSENWSLKEIVKGKPIPFILLTLVFTKAFNEAADYGLTYYFNLNNDHPLYTYNYSLGKFGIILAIPAALLSIWIIKMFIKFKKAPSQSSTATVENEKGNNVPTKNNVEKDIVYSDKGNAQSKKVLIKVGKIALKVWRKVLIFTFKITYGILNSISKNIAHSVDSTMTRWISNIGSTLDSDYNRKKVKDAANWNARQRQKEADHAWNQAANQANYNPNTHHFDEKLNRAERMQREADEAKRNEQNLY